jgi:hypothetical protein
MAIVKKNKPKQTQFKPNTNPFLTSQPPPKANSNPIKPNPNPIKRPLQPWVQRGDWLKRHKQMCLVHYVYFVLSIYTGAPNRQSVTLFLEIFTKFYKTPIICPKTAKKITSEVFNLLFGADYLSFHPEGTARQQDSE